MSTQKVTKARILRAIKKALTEEPLLAGEIAKMEDNAFRVDHDSRSSAMKAIVECVESDNMSSPMGKYLMSVCYNRTFTVTSALISNLSLRIGECCIPDAQLKRMASAIYNSYSFAIDNSN